MGLKMKGCVSVTSECSTCFTCINSFSSHGNSELSVIRDQSPHDKDGGLMSNVSGATQLVNARLQVENIGSLGGFCCVLFFIEI